MTLVSEIIKGAFRESNLIPVNQSPSGDEQAEALTLLNRFVRSLFGTEAGQKLQSFSVGDNNVVASGYLPAPYTFKTTEFVPLNTRLLLNLSASSTINLHPDPEDGSRVAVVDASGNLSTHPLTLIGNGRLIDGATTTVLSTNSLKKEWFYRADLGSWMVITDLESSDTFPFPEEFDDYFTISLATRLNPRNGVALDDQAMLHYRRLRSTFRSRYTQSNIVADSENGLIRLSGTTVNRTTSDLTIR